MNTGLFRFMVTADEHGQRIDRFLVDKTQAAGLVLSRTRLQSLIAEGHVTIGPALAASPGTKVAAGVDVALDIPEPKPAEPEAQAMDLVIVFEDDHLLVLDKPVGLVVHPSAGHEDGTLVNALIAHCGESLSGIGGVRRPGIVHRLDKDTSGLMVVAKTDPAHEGLSATFADHGRSGSLVREYRAFVWGIPEMSSGTVDAAVGRDPHSRLKMAVVATDKGRHAVTHWSCEQRFGDQVALLRCRLETGRTHQIRVHMAAVGHPLVGDAVYGSGFKTKADRLPEPVRTTIGRLGRQALHAASLGFDHPVTGETLIFESALPPDLRMLQTELRAATA